MNNQKDAGTYFIIKQLGNLKLFHKEEWKKYFIDKSIKLINSIEKVDGE